MKIVNLTYFIDAVERGNIKDVFGQIVVGAEKRVYGMDYTYEFERARTGKICELVYAVIP